MHTDSNVSMQPENTYRNAWGVRPGSDAERGDGVYNMQGMYDFAAIPEGFIVRGDHYLEESERVVIFSYNPESEKSEIGWISLNTKEYVKCINDDDITGCKLHFGVNEYIPIESKFMWNGTCSEVHIYWTNGSVLKTLNIDRVDIPIECDDLNLLKCHSAPAPKVYVSDNGGIDLESGTRIYFAQFEDDDGNLTNWFLAGQPVSLGSENNKPGERSRASVYVTIDNLSPYYSKVNIAVAKTISGSTSIYEIAKIHYSTNNLTFIDYSVSQQGREIQPNEILVKKNGYFNAYDLFQYDGRLYVYNLLPEENFNWQKHFENVMVNYVIEGVPMEYAHLHSGMRLDEVYGIALRPNYCDGTSSWPVHIKGRRMLAGEGVKVKAGEGNCSECDKPKWQVHNTAFRTEVLCDDPFSGISEMEEKISYEPGLPTYEVTPKPQDPLSQNDADGIMNEDDLKDMDNNNKRALECICKRLIFLFVSFDMAIFNPLQWYAPNIQNKPIWHLLSDPVAIATARCQCEEMANNGGASESEGGNNNDDDDENDSGTPDTPCDCCDSCGGNMGINGEIETRDGACPCCDRC